MDRQAGGPSRATLEVITRQRVGAQGRRLKRPRTVTGSGTAESKSLKIIGITVDNAGNVTMHDNRGLCVVLRQVYTLLVALGPTNRKSWRAA